MSEILDTKFKYFVGLRIHHDPNEAKCFATYIDVSINKEEAIKIRDFINYCLEAEKK